MFKAIPSLCILLVASLLLFAPGSSLGAAFPEVRSETAAVDQLEFSKDEGFGRQVTTGRIGVDRQVGQRLRYPSGALQGSPRNASPLFPTSRQNGPAADFSRIVFSSTVLRL
jgi:hypothetical protein